MIDHEELRDWFAVPERRGVASNSELAELLGRSEGFVRAEGRMRGCRRIGSALCWTLEDAESLLEDLLAAEEEDEESDEGENAGDDDEDLDEDVDENEDDEEEEDE